MHLVMLLDLQWAWKALQNQDPLPQRHLSPPTRLQDPEEGSQLSRHCLVPSSSSPTCMGHGVPFWDLGSAEPAFPGTGQAGNFERLVVLSCVFRKRPGGGQHTRGALAWMVGGGLPVRVGGEWEERGFPVHHVVWDR